MYNLSR